VELVAKHVYSGTSVSAFELSHGPDF